MHRVIFIFSERGGVGALPDFFFFFASSADHEQRDWSPCKVVFRVGNQYAECEKQHINMKQYTLVYFYYPV